MEVINRFHTVGTVIFVAYTDGVIMASQYAFVKELYASHLFSILLFAFKPKYRNTT